MNENKKTPVHLTQEQKRRQRRKKDIISICISSCAIVLFSVLIAALTKDNNATADDSSMIASDTSEDISMSFTELVEKVIIKDSSCLLGEPYVYASDFIVDNNYSKNLSFEFVTMPDTSKPGTQNIEIRIYSKTGENATRRTTLNVLNIRKQITVYTGSEKVKYSDFVLDNTLSVSMDKEPSEFDYSYPGTHKILLTIGLVEYECILQIVAP